MNKRCLVSLVSFFAAALLAVPPVFAGGIDHEQILKYYRKKNNLSPAVPLSVKNVQDAPIAGAKQGIIQVGNPPRTREETFLVSADGRYVVFGEVEDLTVDPFKKVMEKISLDGEPMKGNKKAKVTIVEYSDFQCPFCARGYNTIEKQVLPEYGDKVRFVYKHFPLNFHPWAEPAAVAVECAGRQSEEAYWKLYSFYFEHQKEITPANLKEKSLEALGDSVDKAKFEKCFDNRETLEQVRAEMAEGQSVGIRGTPGFIINGRLVSGAQPYETFKSIIEDELQSAN
ncbi:MAG: hypothetical protein KatS3mg076_1445 [Candidatus Binatia bacterium]|nr:MAG: hypothetical protein KatS3mg076_1445 [Candidatus Binatia bacterium]